VSINLSLVSIAALNDEWLDTLKEFGVTSIDLAPSHFLDSSSSFRDVSSRNLEFIKNSELNISSIQGLLYDINPNDFTLTDLRIRLDNLSNAALYLGVTKLILGAPSFRKNEGAWECILELFQAAFSGTGISIGVENICVGPCSGTPFGSSSLNQLGFDYVLDVSNALDCSSMCFEGWVSKHDYSYLHLAGRNHVVPQTFREYSEIREIIQHSGSFTPFTWEFKNLEVSQVPMILAMLDDFKSRYEEVN